ncbi:MAG: MFS transporter [Gemmatimonadota bacterium]
MTTMAYRKNLVFAAGCIGMLFFGIALLSMGSLLPSIAERFRMDAITSGMLVSILPFGVLAGSIVFGPIVDRFGYKLLLSLSALVVIAGLEVLAWASSFGVLQLSIFAIGFGGGVLNGGTNALVADISAGERGARLSLLGVFFGVGALGMPVLLGTLRGYEYSTILAGIGVALLAPVLYFGLISFPEPKHAQGFPLREGMTLWRDKGLLLIALTLALQSGLEGVVNNWSTTYLQQERGIDPRDALFALSAFVGGMTVARLALAGILKTTRSDFVLFLGIALSGIGVLVTALSTGVTGASVGLVILGVGLAGGFPLLLGYVADLYPTISGTAFSVALVIALLGNMTINYLVGVMSEWVGAQYLPLYLGACLLLQVGVAAVALKTYHRQAGWRQAAGG